MRGIKAYLTLTAIIFFLTLASMKTVSAQEPTISIIHSETGSNVITFPEGTELNTNFTVNITLTNTNFLAGWQINITYDPTILNVTSPDHVTIPADNVFGSEVDEGILTLGHGTLFYFAGIKLTGPEYVNVTEGTLCQIMFTIIRNDSGLPIQCNIHFVTPDEYPIYTELVDPDAVDIEVTYVDASCTIVPEFSNILLMPVLLTTAAIVIIFSSRRSLIKRRLNQPA